MTLQEAYQGWQQDGQNRQLYANTRNAFRKAWFRLPTNQPCRYYTKEVLGEALAATDEVREMKAKAASVMIHVLAFAHRQEPADNPEPDFTIDQLMMTREPRPQAEDAICQLDAKTLEVIRTWPNPFRIKEEIGVGNVKRAIERCGLAGGFYWSYERDLPERLAERKRRTEAAHRFNRSLTPDPSPTGEGSDAAESDAEGDTAGDTAETVSPAIQMREAASAVGDLVKVFGETRDPSDSAAPVQPAPKSRKRSKTKSGDKNKTKKSGNTKKVGINSAVKTKLPELRPVFQETTKPATENQSAGSRLPMVDRPVEKPSVASQALAVFTDDELFAELDRRGWHGSSAVPRS